MHDGEREPEQAVAERALAAAQPHAEDRDARRRGEPEDDARDRTEKAVRDGPTDERADRGEREQRGESEHAVAPDQCLQVRPTRLDRGWRRPLRGWLRLDHRLGRGRGLHGCAPSESGAELQKVALQPIHGLFQREEARAQLFPVFAHVRQLPLAAEGPSSFSR